MIQAWTEGRQTTPFARAFGSNGSRKTRQRGSDGDCGAFLEGQRRTRLLRPRPDYSSGCVCVRTSLSAPNWSQPLPRPIIIPEVMKLATLADVRGREAS